MSLPQTIGSAFLAAFRGSRRWYFISALTLVGAAWLWWGTGNGADTSAYITMTAERGSIKNSIAATGTVQAVLTVQVGSQVTGRIASLEADFNSVVAKGQVLARIDPANFDAQLERARADLTDARAGVGTADAQVATEQANVQAAKVASVDAIRALTRANELRTDGIVSTRDLEVAQAAADSSAARVDQSQAQVRASQAALEQAKARVDQAKAAVTIAEVTRVYTVITSPVDGVVISRSVDVGQTVSASLSAPTLFTIANDLTKMQVVANVDEADIGSITGEARASFTVDAFPGEAFEGSLSQIRLNPQTQQNVVTYAVLIDFANPDLKLRPGMTANTTFTIAERADALKLPNSALRFWPDAVPREQEREIIAAASSGAGPTREDRGHEQHGNADASRANPQRTSSGLPAADIAGGVIRFPAGRRAIARQRVIWVLGPSAKPEPRIVRVGITDGTSSEVVDGDLKPEEPIIIGRNVSPDSMAATGRSPFSGAMGPMGPRGGGGARPPSRPGR